MVERIPRGRRVARRGGRRRVGEQLVVREHRLHAGAHALEQRLGAPPDAALREFRICLRVLPLPLLLLLQSAACLRVLPPPVSCANNPNPKYLMTISRNLHY